VVRTFSRPAYDNRRLVAADAGAAHIELVANGPVVAGMDLVVVDPEARALRAPAELGEIWISGDSVAHGYWDRPAETAATFRGSLALPDEARRHPGPFLRTGDIGCVVDDELFVTGRIKDLLIVSGRNVHPEDVEAAVEAAHPALYPGGGAVFAVDAGERELVVVVHEVLGRGVDRDEVTAAVRQTVAEVHGVEVDMIVLIRPRTMPKTTSGKVQRRACRERLLSGELRSAVHIWRSRRAAAGTIAAVPAVMAVAP
jgi:acyl-CoA synthetase (AMP-forming)/AMP-acid ligase II